MQLMLRLPQRTEEVLIAVCGGGEKGSDVARKLGVSKQAISKFVREGRARLTEIFVEVAEVLQADLIRINPTRGYAVMKIRQLGLKAYAIYVPGVGPRVLFEDSPRCSGEARKTCREIIRAAKAWGLLERCEGMGSEEEVVECLLRLLES